MPWAPFAFEARWQLAWVLLVRGDWDGALDLCDLSGQTPPAILRAMLDALRLDIEFERGADVCRRS